MGRLFLAYIMIVGSMEFAEGQVVSTCHCSTRSCLLTAVAYSVTQQRAPQVLYSMPPGFCLRVRRRIRFVEHAATLLDKTSTCH
jgi:hypothetical protein